MPNKLSGQHLAPGYWGSPWRFVELSQAPARVRVWLQDKLVARGRWAYLYLPASSATSGAVACTCTKNTTDQADRACLTCYGTKYAPGFLRFMHQTLFWCSAESSSFTLANTTLTTTKKAHILTLATGQTSGTIVTQDKAYANSAGRDYEVKLEAYRRASGSTIALAFSTNGGGVWTNVTLTEVAAPGHGFTGTIPAASLVGSGNVRFRVTLTRASSGDLTPAFEIVRLRRPLSENENRQLTRRRGDHSSTTPGRILILRPWIVEQDSLEDGRGKLIEHIGDRTWTAPLDFFDTSLTRDTPSCRVDDAEGPHPFYVFTSGIHAETRYVITKTSYNDQFGLFTHQFFDDRRAQNGESYHLVW